MCISLISRRLLTVIALTGVTVVVADCDHASVSMPSQTPASNSAPAADALVSGSYAGTIPGVSMFLNGQPLSTSFLTLRQMHGEVSGSWFLGGDEDGVVKGGIDTNDLAAGMFARLTITIRTTDFGDVRITADVTAAD